MKLNKNPLICKKNSITSFPVRVSPKGHPQGGYLPSTKSTTNNKSNFSTHLKSPNLKSKKYDTAYSKLSEVKLITIGLASSEKIRQWAEKTLPNGKVLGQVTNANTLHHKTFKPQKGGLFCERIFGPLKDFQCACGTVLHNTQSNSLVDTLSANVTTEMLNMPLLSTMKAPQANQVARRFCKKCNVEYTWSVIRRYQLGYIQLVSPVTHIWYLKGNPSYLSILLDMKKRHLELVTYCTESLTLENSIKEINSRQTKVPSDMLLAWELTVLSQGQRSPLGDKSPTKDLSFKEKNKLSVKNDSAYSNSFSTSNESKTNWDFQKQKRLKIICKKRSLSSVINIYTTGKLNLSINHQEPVLFKHLKSFYPPKGIFDSLGSSFAKAKEDPREPSFAKAKESNGKAKKVLTKKISILLSLLNKTIYENLAMEYTTDIFQNKKTASLNFSLKKLFKNLPTTIYLFLNLQLILQKQFFFHTKNIMWKKIYLDSFKDSLIVFLCQGQRSPYGDNVSSAYSNFSNLDFFSSKKSELLQNIKDKNLFFSSTSSYINTNKEAFVFLEMVKIKWFNLFLNYMKKTKSQNILNLANLSYLELNLLNNYTLTYKKIIDFSSKNFVNFLVQSEQKQKLFFFSELNSFVPNFKEILTPIFFTFLVKQQHLDYSVLTPLTSNNKKSLRNISPSLQNPLLKSGLTKVKKNNKKIKNNLILDTNNNAKKATNTLKLVNNVYTVSHRERWTDDEWQNFNDYMSSPVQSNNFNKSFTLEKTNSKSYLNYNKLMIIPDYNNRIFNILNDNFFSFGDGLFNTSIIPVRGSLPVDSFAKANNKKNTSYYSGPGMIQQLLNELDFSELEKIDKQNRILLYQLNKYIFLLKKRIFNKSAKKELKECYKKRDQLIRRTKLIRTFFRKDSKPNSMILTVLPVLPPDLRPIVKIGGQIAASDLNRLYQRVIYRNERLKKFLKEASTSSSYEMKYAQRLLQEAVDNLIQNGKSGSSSEKDARGRALKSLSDLLKGKQGRFRQYLLGKRVDYSGRSVIVVGPKLKLHECGLPKEMALELYLPFLLKRLINHNYARTVVGAKNIIKKAPDLIWELLKEIMQSCPVLLNRAPTLHRLGIQAFQPKLIEGRAILLHPLVCPAFNADFDGDQMAVHVPITIEARAEAWKLMSARQNFLSPATGEPLAIPSQDMVLGCYYLTTHCNKPTIKNQKGTALSFSNLSDVLNAYRRQIIDLHAMIWVKFEGLLEQGNDIDEPIEIRVNNYGNWNEIYKYIQKNYSISKSNKNLTTSTMINQYICTTPGRILFNSIIQSI